MGAVSRLADRQQAEGVALAAAGDEIAFRRIIAAHHEDMRRVCLAFSGDSSVADEAVQAAWLVAWKKLDRVSSPEQLRPWLVSVAVKGDTTSSRPGSWRVTAWPASMARH